MEVGEFHWSDGWYFRRLAEGRVRVQRRVINPVSGKEYTIAEMNIPATEWASIIAWVSVRGESAAYPDALALHAGAGMPSNEEAVQEAIRAGVIATEKMKEERDIALGALTTRANDIKALEDDIRHLLNLIQSARRDELFMATLTYLPLRLQRQIDGESRAKAGSHG